MFYYLSQFPAWLEANGHAQWADWLSGLRVFQYITFRGAGAAITALLICWWLGPRVRVAGPVHGLVALAARH